MGGTQPSAGIMSFSLFGKAGPATAAMEPQQDAEEGLRAQGTVTLYCDGTEHQGVHNGFQSTH